MNAEDAIQSQFFETLIRWGGGDLLPFSVPNEGKRSKAEGARLKANGLTPGAADTVVLWPGGGCLIEFKSAKGTQSTAQCEFENRATAISWPYAVCRSWPEAWRFLEDAGAPLAHVWRTDPERFVRVGG